MLSAIKQSEVRVYEQIESHVAWYGNISGLVAEKMLEGRQRPFLYMLRKGEDLGDYYISFILPDFSVKHQPFVIRMIPNGWEAENGTTTICPPEKSIEDVLHLMMHCAQSECAPFYRLQVK